MLVILRENVENLGQMGEVVKVSDGYARNFLLPRKLVVQASRKNIETIEQYKKSLEKKRLAQKVIAQENAQKLKEFSCTIARKVGDHDRLFGSVTISDIVDLLKQSGFTQIEKRNILLDAPIKTLGVHSVSIKFELDVSAVLKITVVKEAS